MRVSLSNLTAHFKHRKIRALPVVLSILTIIILSSCVQNSNVTSSGSSSLPNEVVFIEEPDSSKAVRELEAGTIQVYAGGLTDPELVQRIKTSSAMGYETSYGLSDELTFNPSGPAFKNGKLNPFSVPAIREAMNRLIDRRYIAEEIYRGQAVPRYFALNTAFSDYAKLAPVARVLEIQYAPDNARAKETIATEMKKLGATLSDGKWNYQGKSVEINFLIRTEDKRKDIGDYIATQLENAGFVVNRLYKGGQDASAIWVASDPAEGKWNIYTGGWSSTIISRDQSSNFAYYYTSIGRPDPLWQAYKPAPDFAKVADTLDRGDYKTVEERQQLMSDALKLSMQDSVRVWLVDTLNVTPHRANIAVTADLSGGVAGSSLWPYTLRYTDKTGGSMTVAVPGLLTEPWNPLAGTNWLYDRMIMHGIDDPVDLPDPFTGLIFPNHVKSAEVTVQQGLPVTRTQNWLTLNFVPTIQVPKDAWIEWDAKAQGFKSVGEVYPDGLTARTKVVIHYSDDLLQMPFHNGSKLTMADIMLGLAVGFDRAQKDSAIFDESEVSSFEAYKKTFKGMRIVQENPLVAEVYSDQIYPDAEWIADGADGYYYMSIPWEMISIGILAEQNHELAFSSSKAQALELEQMSFIAGPSLPILEKYRQQALKDKYIPYPNFMSKYLTPDEAAKRYAALGDWYQQRGHFWIGNGPYYLDSVHTVQKTVVLKRFDQYRQTQQNLSSFTSPKIADVKVSGPTQLQIGTVAEFQVNVTFKGKPYASSEMDFVKYLLFGNNSALLASGDAEFVKDGQWRVSLSADRSKQLRAGASRLEIIVTPKVVSVASFNSFTFAVVP